MKHIAIIMDGNRRWAKRNKMKALSGHRHAAYETIEPLVDACIAHDISYLTLWAFSTENWDRTPAEVEGIMNLFRETLTENIDKFHRRGVRVQSIGDMSRFPQDIQEQVAGGIEKTKHNDKMTLSLALNYGGRDEILRAIEKIRTTEVANHPITEEAFEQYLDTTSMPDPDMIIRTGGDTRLSGFLLWQCAYSELYFTDVLFPDFTPEELENALAEFARRKRNFGK